MDQTLAVLKSLSDKNRLRILNVLLGHEKLCACQITELLGLSGATVSRHLSVMVSAGVLKNSKQGRWIYFFINPDADGLMPLFSWVKQRIKDAPQTRKDSKALDHILSVPCEDLSLKQRNKGIKK